MDLGGVRAQPQMLWGEDLGPETPVDHPDIPQGTRPESSQDIVDGSSDSDEEEWKYVRGNVKSADKEEKMDDPQNDMKSQLNPNATEFVPGFPSVEKDEFIASSPNIGKVTSKDLDDIVVPSESEFNRDIATKACDLEAASDGDAINTSAEPSSRREIDFNCSTGEVKTDSVTLILSPLTTDNESPVTEEKIDTNPFAADIETSKKGNTDHVNFVQDYFGTSEVDFKPFESVTSHTVDEKVFDEDSVESQIPNSVSAEISSHFNFIDSHLENSESERPEETEKERNQLEIKEPESPINSEHLNNGIVNSDGQPGESVTKPVDNTSEVDLIANVFESHPSEIEVLKHEFNIEDSQVNIVKDMIAEASSEHLTTDVDRVNIIESDDMFCFENREDIPVTVQVDKFHVSNEITHDAFVKCNQEDEEHHADVENDIRSDFSKEFISGIVTEEVPHFLSETENKEKEYVGEHADFLSGSAGGQDIFVKTEDNCGYNDQGPDLSQVKRCPFENKELFNIEEFSNEDSEAKFINDTEKIVSEILDVSSDSNQTEFNNIKEKKVIVNYEEVLQITDPSEVENKEFVNSHVDEIQPTTEPIPDQDKIEENIVNATDENISQSTEATPELADTIGPNSFSFSQPIEVVKFEITGMTALEFTNRFGTSDIMMTSMHESLEPDSSFEFISVCPAKESNIIEIDDQKEQENTSSVASDLIHEAPDNNTKENGIDHIESSEMIPPKIEGIKTIFDTQSVIVESREMPVSSEPDVVFVEQIYPTVEVSSDEATPVSKENSSFDLASAAVTAAGVTAVTAGAAVLASSLIPVEKQPEHPLKEDIKSAEDTKATVKTATKAPATKKPAASGAKPPLSKPPSAKTAPMKSSSLISAKPKAPTTTKPAATTTAKKPTSTTKPAVAPVPKTAPLSKPAAKTSVPPTNKAPAKVPTMPTTKPASNASKPALRPASAPTKPTAPLSAKPALSSRTTATAPRAPLAAKKPTTTTASKPLASSRPASETKVSAKPAVPRTTSLTAAKPAPPKTATMLGSKPPTKLGLSAAPTAKPKTTSPTKPSPIKAKAPLTGPKKPTTTTTSAKKPPTVLDKNAKNAVKPVPKDTAQKEISTKEIKEEKEHESSTTNGHHIENGNITPHEEITSPIII